jgi:general L-amino acid transport system permease protein
MSLETYKPGSYPNLPPPLGTVGVSGWVKNNLFSSISNSLLTILSVTLLYYLIVGIVDWELLIEKTRFNWSTISSFLD